MAGLALAGVLGAGCQKRVVSQGTYTSPQLFNTPRRVEDPRPKPPKQPMSFPNPLAWVGNGIGALFRPFAPKPKPPTPQPATPATPAPAPYPGAITGAGVGRSEGGDYKARVQDGKSSPGLPAQGSGTADH